MAETFSCGFLRAQLILCGKSTHPTRLIEEAYNKVNDQFGVNEHPIKYLGERLGVLCIGMN